MRVSMDLASPRTQMAAVGVEVRDLLWPDRRGFAPRSATLEDGPTVNLTWVSGLMHSSPYELVGVPDDFWRWWAKRGRPIDIILSCLDGEEGRYAIRAAEPVEETAQQAANARLEQVARTLVKRSQGACFLLYFGRRLIASGIYHQFPPPVPSPTSLFGRDKPLRVDRHDVIDLSRMTGVARKLAEAELEEERLESMALIRESLGLPAAKEPEMEPAKTPRGADAVAKTYRLRVRLKWMPEVWRIIELTGDRTLHELHHEIQDAFGWDDDHLYSFFMSGKRWDQRTEIPGPVPFRDATGSSADIMVGELELRPRQRFLYLFDYGDQLEHDIQVLSVVDNPTRDSFIRIAEEHGEAPPQYPEWDEE